MENENKESESYLSGGQFTEDQPASVPRDTMRRRPTQKEGYFRYRGGEASDGEAAQAIPFHQEQGRRPAED